MNWKTKRCCDGRLRRCCVDRISNLPDELLGQILSLLPTKDAAATQVLCKRMQKAFTSSLLTSIDLDDSPISHCQVSPHLVDRFCVFEAFVDSVLQMLSKTSPALTRFRLRFGGDQTKLLFHQDKRHVCGLGFRHYDDCFPYLEPARLSAWMCFLSTTTTSLRELDFYVHVKNQGTFNLHPGVFACQTLEVLKIDSNLELSDEEIPLICLPKLRILGLHSLIINDDDFVTRLVSSCPLLEDLDITQCWWETSDRLMISAPSLLRLEISILKPGDVTSNQLVFIDAPNLQYFAYGDALAYRYSITTMNDLVTARLSISHALDSGTCEATLQKQLSLINLVSHVQHLSLLDQWIQNVHYGGGLKGQLPMFHSLKTLELGGNTCMGRWGNMLLEILHCLPILEMLAFPEGLYDSLMHYRREHDVLAGATASDLEFWTTTQAIPSCCQSHLKQIVVKHCCRREAEVNLVNFLLSTATVLQDLVIYLSKSEQVSDVDRMAFEAAMLERPKASRTCSIRVLR